MNNNFTTLERWQNDVEYRKAVVKEIEDKYNLRLNERAFGSIVN